MYSEVNTLRLMHTNELVLRVLKSAAATHATRGGAGGVREHLLEHLEIKVDQVGERRSQHLAVGAP